MKINFEMSVKSDYSTCVSDVGSGHVLFQRNKQT